jgi:hypothetical protein
MRNRVLIIVAAIAVAVLLFSAGILVQREFQLAQIRNIEIFARDLAGLDEPVPPAPRWENWQYPHAKSLSHIQGSATRVMEELVRPAGHYAVCVTTDAFEDVARFYAEKAHFDEPDEVAQSRLATSSHGTLTESNHWMDDDTAAADAQQSRPVRSKCMIRRCPAYDLSVFITRADGEAPTHIVVLYDPKTETGDAQP